MKTSTIGIVSAAFLIVVACVGFGVAQAGETHAIGELMEGQTPEQGVSSSPYLESRPVLAFEDELQQRNPTETGSLPEMSIAYTSNVGIEEHNYLGGEDIDSSMVGTEEHNYLGGEDIDDGTK
jgi:hypothetical protein